MKLFRHLLFALSLLIVSGLPAANKPNIIVILCDDMGYSDIGCYGGEIQTPHLDQLASTGIRFTQFYNTARCCPTRAALLSGLYSHQAGIGHMTDAFSPQLNDSYRGDLSPKAVTIAEALKPAGYRAYALGKWHVCRNVGPDGDKHNWPLQRGFDRYYGTITGAGSYYDPGTLTRDNTAISPFADADYKPEQFYYTRAITDHAVRFIDDHQKDHANQPFFMYVAYTAAHWPLHAPEADVAKYQGKYDAGYEAIRKARFEKMKKLHLVTGDWEMSPTAHEWNKVENKAWEARCMEVYAAQISIMDEGVGKIVETLKKQGQFENTLIMWLQDNGGCAEPIGRKKDMTRPDKPTLPPIAADALRQDVIPKQNRAGVPTLQGQKIMPGPEDTYIAYGQGWANVSNTPFREYKHWEHEGGISTPMIAHWPKGIDSTCGNTLEREPAHLIDIMATCLDVAGADYPKERQGIALWPKQGSSLRPLFKGDPLERGHPIFFEHEGNKAVRDGRWKLVSKHAQPWELYNMESDRTEMHDLSAQYPEKVQSMGAQWAKWSEEVGVLPWPLKKK